MTEKKLVEIVKIEHKEIAVNMTVDYINRRIGMVDILMDVNYHSQEKGVRTEGKKWVFCNRGPEYMDGWLDILEAMKKATLWAKARFKEYDADAEAELEVSMDNAADIMHGIISHLNPNKGKPKAKPKAR